MSDMTGEDGDGLTQRVDAPKSPPAPGASQSPQKPGMVPDRSTVPGHFSERVGPPTTKRRPISQYGTAEELLAVFKQEPEADIEPKDFEQATASFEEVRKAELWELPPVRPVDRALAAGEAPTALPETSA